jgi:hypothetical protein
MEHHQIMTLSGPLVFRTPGPKKEGTGLAAGPLKAVQQLAFGNDGRRGFALSDVLRAACDAQESEHRGHSQRELLHRSRPLVMTHQENQSDYSVASAEKTQ